MSILLNFTLVVIGFVLLIKGADFLVNGASSLAKRFNVSDIAIGLTVVAMGTSAPELVVNIISGGVTSQETGTQDVVFANIIGSNIFNVFMILGVCAVIYPLTVQKNALWKEIPYSILASFIFFVLINDAIFFGASSSTLSMVDALILIGMFILFLVYIFMNLSRGDESEAQGIDDIVVYGSVKTTLMICLGLAGLIFGGQMIVDNAVQIAETFGVSEKMIGLTILAAGTSLPELATSAVAAFQKKSDLAVGNIVGSNIFNLLLVIGATGLIHGNLAYNDVMNTDIYLMIIGTFMLFVFMFTFAKYRLDRAEGFIYLAVFFGYMYFLFEREGYGWGIFF